MPPTTRSKARKAAIRENSFALSSLDLSPASAARALALPTDAASVISTVYSDSDDVPPVYTIDLSLPPAQRYVQVALDYKLIVEDLTEIFDELLDSVNLPKKTFHFLARCVLRKLWSKEQTQELKGIGKVTGVPMYLLVAYNVLLDLFMGCTSGGVVVKEVNERKGRMMHFRTLDWSMPALRKAVVQFEFKHGKDGEVIARSVNYVGFVGMLTGVRKGLSVSLNFRPYHNDDSSKWANVKFYSHFLMVLLGWRPSITSHLRNILLPTTTGRKRRKLGIKKEKDEHLHTSSNKYSHNSLASIASDFPTTPTTAAYLTFCDGSQTLVLEKDRVTAKPLLSSLFIAVTNHDTSYEPSTSLEPSAPSTASASQAHAAHAKTQNLGINMDDVVDESIDRKGCLTSKWDARCEVQKETEGEGQERYVELELLKEWLLEFPVTNEMTHFVAIMDPERGEMRWCRTWEEGQITGPVEFGWSESDEEGSVA